MAYPIAMRTIVKTLSRRAFTLALTFILAAPAGADPCGLLWRVEAPGGATSHLFGTIHSEDPRVLSLPEAVEEAFADADTYVMEMIPDFSSMGALVSAMHFQDERNLRGVLGDDLFDRAVQALSDHGIGSGLALKMKPWAVAVTLSFPKPETGLFLDMMLFNRALSQGKTTEGLESAEEQLAFFVGLEMQDQIRLLEATLAQDDDIDEAMDGLIQAWLSRDPEALDRLSDQYMEELPSELAERFEREAIVRRNRVMAERLSSHLEEGGTFTAVGALHLYGEDGLIELLRRQRNEVSCVY